MQQANRFTINRLPENTGTDIVHRLNRLQDSKNFDAATFVIIYKQVILRKYWESEITQTDQEQSNHQAE